ncbi:MAG: ABC transporter ATP-binding protein [Eubacterium sp.]|nr:ABC transporter ATP-binding protein [Eubacterium sp.]
MSHINIKVENVSFGYEKGAEILSQISLHAKENDSIGIIGANGVGKSTLLKLLVGLYLNFDGSIRIEDVPVQKSTLPLIRSKIGYVFQDSDSQLFMTTAYEDIAFAPRNYGLPENEVQSRVEQALRLTGIEHLRDKQIYKMSGGEKKLVSIATILSMTPDIILMDEPSIALDPKNRRVLINILNSFEHLKLIASHDLDLILDTCERTVLMAGGKIICDGPTKEILTNRELLEANGLELPFCLQKR